MCSAPLATRGGQAGKVEREVVGPEGGRFSEVCTGGKGEATQCMNGCQISLFSGGSPTWRKVLLPQTIKYMPHPETAGKKMNKTTLSESRKVCSKPGRNSFVQNCLMEVVQDGEHLGIRAA